MTDAGRSRTASLRWLIVVALLVTALAPLTTAAILSLTSQHAALTTRVEDDLDQYADAQAARVELILSRADATAQLVTSRTLLRELVSRTVAGPSDDIPRIETILDDARDASEGLRSIVLLDVDGVRVAGTSHLPGRSELSGEVLAGLHTLADPAATVVDLRPGRDEPVWLAAAPVLQDDTLVAFAVMDLDPEPLLQVLTPTPGEQEPSIRTCLYVAGPGGGPVAIERDGGCLSSVRTGPAVALEAPQASLGTEPEFLVDARDEDGNPAYAATRPLTEYGVGLVLSMPAAQLLSPVTEATWDLVSLFLAVAALALAASLLLGRWLTRPLVSLQQATARMAEGELGTELPPSSLRELAELRSSFDSMKLAVLAEQADQEDRYRDLEMLTHAMAHDLKGPLTVIRGMQELVASGRVATDDERRVLLERSLAATLRMQHLIDDLLSLIRAIGAPLDDEPVPLGAVMREVVEELGLEEVTTLGPLPTVQGERTLLAQVALNLLHNAATYHRADEVPRIEVSTGPRRSGLVALVIDDAGVGIPEADRSEMLETFARGDHADRSSGTGLGLPIAKRVAERHGGGIEVDDSPLGGTRILVWLPEADPPAGGVREGARQSDGAVV